MLERIIYTAEPGERLKLLKDGRTLIIHPDKRPRVLHPDGKIETLEIDPACSGCAGITHHHTCADPANQPKV